MRVATNAATGPVGITRTRCQSRTRSTSTPHRYWTRTVGPTAPLAGRGRYKRDTNGRNLSTFAQVSMGQSVSITTSDVCGGRGGTGLETTERPLTCENAGSGAVLVRPERPVRPHRALLCPQPSRRHTDKSGTTVITTHRRTSMPATTTTTKTSYGYTSALRGNLTPDEARVWFNDVKSAIAGTQSSATGTRRSSRAAGCGAASASSPPPRTTS